ncbi:hypothetical protein GCM10018787_05350 [Streptomyces thermodiastaticus]|nr:hypothetical protein GCM10018787_05350 [Streptomyces thermodiastaticus]
MSECERKAREKPERLSFVYEDRRSGHEGVRPAGEDHRRDSRCAGRPGRPDGVAALTAGLLS